MFSALVSLFKAGKSHAWRVYINGVEIDKIEPKLEFLALDDWMTPFLHYVFEERKDWGDTFYIHTEKNPAVDKNAPMDIVWFGPLTNEVRKKGGYWTTLTYNGKENKTQ